MDNDEFNTLDGIDTTSTIETRLDTLELIDTDDYLNKTTGGDLEGLTRMTNGADFVITSGSDLVIRNLATLTLEAGSNFIGNNLIDANDLADESVTTDEIENDTIVNADINSIAEIEFSKMESLTADRIVITDGDGYLTTSDLDPSQLDSIAMINSSSGSLFITGRADAGANSAERNTGIGIDALRIITSGDENTAIGYGAGSNLTTGSGNVLIGYSAQASAFNATDELVISNGTDLITGNFSTNDLEIHGNLEVTGELSAGIVSYAEFSTLDGIDTSQKIQTRLINLESIALSVNIRDTPDTDTSISGSGCPVGENIDRGKLQMCFRTIGKIIPVDLW